MAVVPEERRAFRRRFRRAKKASAPGECGLVGGFLGGRTPIRVVATAFGWEPFRLRSIADMFPESGMQSNFLNEFYVMDVIVNRRSAPLTAASGGGHAVCHAQSYIPDDGAPDGDYQFRAVILFLPQCGVFYCSRDRHAGDAGLQGTLRAYDMSWLRLVRTESEHCLPSYTFGDDSYVQRFYSDTTLPCGTRQVSAWRLSTGRVLPGQQVRLVYRASQEGWRVALLPPDFIGGMDYRDVPSDYRAHEYLDRLKASSSAREGCRHYVDGARHTDLPESCWIIDPNVHHFVDVHIAIDEIPDRVSVVMVRNVGKMDPRDDRQQLLDELTERCSAIKLAGGKGTARAKSSDVGGMIAIGTRITVKKGDSVDCPAVHDKVPYAANSIVGEDVVRGLVVDLADVGSSMTTDDDDDDDDDDDGDDGGNYNCGVVDDDLFITARLLADAQAKKTQANTANARRLDFLSRKIRGLLAVLERRRRVAYTIDLSYNLGNSSHFDVNDASQGYSCWTEEMLGWGENWYFIMPNVEGKRPNGTKFTGLAIKLGHGIAISWDGRIVRHCTSVSCPDGLDSGYVGVAKDSTSFVNTLYGVFTCAKEKIVQAGRAGCAANYRPVLRPDPWRERVPSKKRLNRKRRRRRKHRDELTVAQNPIEDEVIATAATLEAAAVEPISVRLPKHVVTVSRQLSLVGRKRKPQVEPGMGTSANGGGVDGERKAVPRQPTAADLAIGGAYTVPRKKELVMCRGYCGG
ncbi:hypothetical protein MHU86_1336 [Fragilaria crotonensis]|nr:hypothetical protein MHU86_1336 [Fragilaria crotonensis]